MSCNKLMEKFYESWRYLNKLEIIMHNELSLFEKSLSVQVTKINPATLEIDDDEKLNTKVVIRLEFGEIIFTEDTKKIEAVHDPELDVAADTFEEAIIELARLCREKGYKEHVYNPITKDDIKKLEELYENQKR